MRIRVRLHHSAGNPSSLLRVAMPPRKSPRNDQEKLEEILQLLSDFSWTLGFFLLLLFTNFSHLKDFKEGKIQQRTDRHAAFVSRLLSQAPKDSANGIRNIISVIYNHSDSVPIKHRATASRSALPSKDHTPMARHQLLLWACRTVLDQVLSEVTNLIQHPSLRMPLSRQSWEMVLEFSLANLQSCVQKNAPVLYMLLVSAATPSTPALTTGSHERNPKLVSS
jgi:hypothetical protein